MPANPVGRADCGHTYEQRGCGTGYAHTVEPWVGAFTYCYPCADAIARAEVRHAPRVFGYLSGDARSITTWTGGPLMRVTAHWTRRVNIDGSERHYLRAVAPDGSRWHGNGAGPNMFARMRRCRHA